MKKANALMFFLPLALWAAELPVPEGTTAARAVFKAGKEPVSIEIQWQDGTRKKITVAPEESNYMIDGNSGLSCKMPEAGFAFKGLGVYDFVRPNAALYVKSKRESLMQRYPELPEIYGKKYTLLISNDTHGAEFFINGNYAGRCDTKTPVIKTINTSLPESAFKFSKTKINHRFLPLDIGFKNNPGNFSDAKVKLKDESIPFLRPTSANLDLGTTAAQLSLYPNTYGNSGQTGRNAFDNAEASYLFTIPMKQYSRAWILCACESNPAKFPEFTARITRYVPSSHMGGRAYSALGDTRCKVSGKSAVKVGTVNVNGKTLQLWRVEALLNLGKIIDLITDYHGKWGRGAFNMHYLDFELMGITPLYRTPFGDPRVYPAPDRPSSVHVFGVTLERSPIDVKFIETTPSRNMFDDTMKPEMKVAYSRNFPGKYVLEWSITDAYGQDSGKGSVILDGSTGEKTIDLAQKDLGWYQVKFRVIDANTGKTQIEHIASYALMGKDTRRAGYESPYTGWAFGNAHYGDGSLELNGLRYRMLGLHRLTSLDSYSGKKFTEKDWEQYKVTTFNVSSRFAHLPSQSDEKIADEIKTQLQKWPNAKYLPLFWENSSPFGPYGQAPELYGMPVPAYDENRQKQADRRWETFLKCQRILKDFPQVKVLIGNTMTSTELIAETLRRKPPKDFIYAIGTEAIQRTAHPEKPNLQFTMMYSRQMTDVAKLLGYDLKVTCGPENVCRKSETIGLFRTAEWRVRDMLLQHVFGFETIGGADDGYGSGNSYNSSFYGGGTGRAPYLYPEPSATATGTLTKVLDCVKFLGLVPTGSNTVYAAEFFREYDKKYVYAFWTSRGNAELGIRTGSSNVELVEFHGKSTTPSVTDNKLNLTASTAARYMLSDAKLQSITMGKREYTNPEEDVMTPDFKVIDHVTSSTKWTLATAPEPLLEGKDYNMLRKLAKNATVKEVTDSEKGKCLELSIKSDKSLNSQWSEYMIIRPGKAIPINEETNTIGLWVKGNSGWGEIYWELEDANGVRRISSSTEVHGANVLDYGARISLNYDGWCFLSMPVTERSRIRELSTGAVKNIWAGTWSTPVMPLKLTGIVFCAPAHPQFLHEYKDCEQTIRVKDVAAISTPKAKVSPEDYERKLLVLSGQNTFESLNSIFRQNGWLAELSPEYIKKGQWYEIGYVFPYFEQILNSKTDAVCCIESTLTKNSLDSLEKYVKNGGIVIMTYNTYGLLVDKDKGLASRLSGIKKFKALHEVPYTQTVELKHNLQYLPVMGKEKRYTVSAIYSLFAAEIATATPLIENTDEKGLFAATINKYGTGKFIVYGIHGVSSKQEMCDLLNFAFKWK